MKVIGLTGGSGAGKTTISKMLEEEGAIIINGDLIAREIVEAKKPALLEITETFGKDILYKDGTLNRKKLGQIVFSDKKALESLNKIMYKKIYEEIENRINTLNQREENPLIVVDAPILFEMKLDRLVNEVWIVTASKELRISRIMERDFLTKEEAENRINSQVDMEQYASLAKVIIENNGDLDKIKKEVINSLKAT